jgi:prephenate dehydratase
MIKIGYQGVENSNNYIAAKKFVESNKMENYVLVPLISSENVVNHLLNKEIDLGIMAISNSIIGQVTETKNASGNKGLTEVSRVEVTIKHAAFKLNSDLSNLNVKYVASHEAALGQCKYNIGLNYPNAELIPIRNAGLGPQMLVDGKLDSSSVVICPPKAGEKYDLVMDHENLSDTYDNVTSFGIFKLTN